MCEADKTQRVVLRVDGMSCMSCVQGVTSALEKVRGTSEVCVDLSKGLAELKYSGETSTLIEAVKKDAGKCAKVEDSLSEVRLRIDGMSCMGCVGSVTNALKNVSQTSHVSVDLEAGMATLRYPGDVSVLVQAVKQHAGKDAVSESS